jgi:protein-tyrosine phosphatase
MGTVLFVCRANQFRSAFAAACLRKKIREIAQGSTISISSAGTWATQGASVPFAVIELANSIGLPGLSRHRTRRIDYTILKSSDVIIVMELGQREGILSEFPEFRSRVYLLSELAEGSIFDIPDPALPGINQLAVALDICRLVEKCSPRIIEMFNEING